MLGISGSVRVVGLPLSKVVVVIVAWKVADLCTLNEEKTKNIVLER